MEILTNQDSVQDIASGFGFRNAFVQPLGSGLIHHTYKAVENGEAIVLQQINTRVVADPQALVENYLVIYEHLQHHGDIKIPAPVPTTNGGWLLRDNNNETWRATEYIANSYSPAATENARAAYTTASSFGR